MTRLSSAAVCAWRVHTYPSIKAKKDQHFKKKADLFCSVLCYRLLFRQNPCWPRPSLTAHEFRDMRYKVVCARHAYAVLDLYAQL